MAKEKFVMKNWNGTSWDTLYPRTDGESVYLDGYVKPPQNGTIVPSDTVNAAVGKLEKGLDDKQNMLGYTPENAANKGKANGYAGLDATGKIPSGLLPQTNGLNYKGTMDAAAGYPGNPAAGDFYIITAAGTISEIEYNTGDWAVYNGEAAGWAKIDNTDEVASVNAMTGAVELTGANLTMAGYTKPVSGGAVAAADTVNAAVGKLEKGLEGKQAAGNYVVSNGSVTAGTKTKITYDAKGLITGGEDATAADIKMTGYVKAATAADVAAADTALEAIGKVEKKTDGKVDGNAAVLGGTKTKITYDAKGLVTAGTDATAGDFKIGTYSRGTGDVSSTDTVSAAIGKLETKSDAKAKIIISSAEPPGAAVGDFWYQTV
ncbi:hypothetical protein [Christensenella tenuis]|uniref:Uncharacterized protein n=1 Tax=Christensenella tenuis TaxID=2763033 RepID=A0ABR7EEQ2_9FIRM|nr:hypothetical protein [Christensenella tenuis]MBC5648251.1 hypothetical protein [Christensenella tenuis]